MVSMDPLVVAVVLNWNQPEETADCVASLLAGAYPRLQALVVDNGSADDSVSQLRGRFGEQICVVETGTNLYYAGGNNIGLKWALEAGATWVLILNNDTVVALIWSARCTGWWGRFGAGVWRLISVGDRMRIWAGPATSWLPMPRDRAGRDRCGQYTAPCRGLRDRCG
jgi:glycosyltransferase involved in cell wall biosynthesis